ncbi:Uncharacterized protein Adt_23476 [Abeliophyllum distichum]|uniref:Uncharacterized protein n=1 Tax=Abeliophyllum distichum TaxID=126358 RepID=A0ABD1SBT4_9LAMI
MKFPTLAGISTVKENQESAQECYLNALRKEALRALVTDTFMMVDTSTHAEVEGHIRMDDSLDPRILESNSKAATVEELEEFSVEKEDGTTFLRIGCRLKPEMKDNLKEFLKANIDVLRGNTLIWLG